MITIHHASPSVPEPSEPIDLLAVVDAADPCSGARDLTRMASGNDTTGAACVEVLGDDDRLVLRTGDAASFASVAISAARGARGVVAMSLGALARNGAPDGGTATLTSAGDSVRVEYSSGATCVRPSRVRKRGSVEGHVAHSVPCGEIDAAALAVALHEASGHPSGIQLAANALLVVARRPAQLERGNRAGQLTHGSFGRFERFALSGRSTSKLRAFLAAVPAGRQVSLRSTNGYLFFDADVVLLGAPSGSELADFRGPARAPDAILPRREFERALEWAGAETRADDRVVFCAERGRPWIGVLGRNTKGLRPLAGTIATVAAERLSISREGAAYACSAIITSSRRVATVRLWLESTRLVCVGMPADGDAPTSAFAEVVANEKAGV